MFAIAAGDMRQRVTIEANAPTQDKKGQAVPSWSAVATRWAAILPASGQAFVASEQVRNLTTHKVVMRYFAGLSPDVHRLRYGSRVFNVLSILNESERNVRHTLLVQELLQ
ncbi:MAG: phage head closure protein [Planctomycetes bacterium]|nr:phage head closure protein [Planctomycetota bacterium]